VQPSPTDAILRALPLRVTEVNYNDPTLVLIGEDWSLALTCPWVITGPTSTYDWESDSVEDQAWELIGHDIESVAYETDILEDPQFRFSGGITLTITADDDWDPWVMNVSGRWFVGGVKH
jgi:hypothetical protein